MRPNFQSKNAKNLIAHQHLVFSSFLLPYNNNKKHFYATFIQTKHTESKTRIFSEYDLQYFERQIRKQVSLPKI